MTFAFINEAWGTNDLKTTRRKTKVNEVDNCALYKNYPKDRIGMDTNKATYIQNKTQVYDIQPDDYNKNIPFIDYDDFYKSDFQYATKIDEPKQVENPIIREEVITEHQPTFEESVIRPHVQDAYETFAQNASQSYDKKEQLYLEFILYIVCGIFLILILEQVLTIGTKLVK
jgi:hypothetical protein